LIYLAGPIFGCSDEDAKGWRTVVKELLGASNVLDPMDRDYRGVEDANGQKLVEDDLRDIAQCAALLVKANEPSWGTAMELVYARQMGKPVVAFNTSRRVSPWLRYHASVHYTLKDALTEVMKHGGIKCLNTSAVPSRPLTQLSLLGKVPTP
jgi:nucleoside 2-deoxyribosyltransferase